MARPYRTPLANAVAAQPSLSQRQRELEKVASQSTDRADHEKALADYKTQYLQAIASGVPQGSLHPPSAGMDLRAAHERLNFMQGGKGNANPNAGPIDRSTSRTAWMGQEGVENPPPPGPQGPQKVTVEQPRDPKSVIAPKATGNEGKAYADEDLARNKDFYAPHDAIVTKAAPSAPKAKGMDVNSPAIQTALDRAAGITPDMAGHPMAPGASRNASTQYGQGSVRMAQPDEGLMPSSPIVQNSTDSAAESGAGRHRSIAGAAAPQASEEVGVGRMSHDEMRADLFKRHPNIFKAGSDENKAYVAHAHQFGEAHAFQNVDGLMATAKDQFGNFNQPQPDAATLQHAQAAMQARNAPNTRGDLGDRAERQPLDAGGVADPFAKRPQISIRDRDLGENSPTGATTALFNMKGRDLGEPASATPSAAGIPTAHPAGVPPTQTTAGPIDQTPKIVPQGPPALPNGPAPMPNNVPAASTNAPKGAEGIDPYQFVDRSMDQFRGSPGSKTAPSWPDQMRGAPASAPKQSPGITMGAGGDKGAPGVGGPSGPTPSATPVAVPTPAPSPVPTPTPAPIASAAAAEPDVSKMTPEEFQNYVDQPENRALEQQGYDMRHPGGRGRPAPVRPLDRAAAMPSAAPTPAPTPQAPAPAPVPIANDPNKKRFLTAAR